MRTIWRKIAFNFLKYKIMLAIKMEKNTPWDWCGFDFFICSWVRVSLVKRKWTPLIYHYILHLLKKWKLPLSEMDVFALKKLMEILPQEKSTGNLSRGKVLSSQVRASMEGMFKNHFGEEIIDEFFDSFHKKLNELSEFESGNGGSLFILLKRMATI